jgi:hypothetical protein
MSPNVAVPVAHGQRALAQHSLEVRLCLPCSCSCRLPRAVSTRQTHLRLGQCHNPTAPLPSSVATKTRRAPHAPLRMTHPAEIRG